MESRLIYESHKTYQNKITWKIFKNESEWIYLGIGKEVDEKKIKEIIDENFCELILYFVTDRNCSLTISKTDISRKISMNFRDINVFVWNQEFKKVLEFDKNGVFRIGNRF